MLSAFGAVTRIVLTMLWHNMISYGGHVVMDHKVNQVWSCDKVKESLDLGFVY